ncbi:MAG: hypothetical protein U9R16_07010 [Campylobacterota bacterium]|nr:hypothetical protein [Campylobacterota bacterium]
MDLKELKKRREENLLAHKKKKRAYYIKTKLKNREQNVEKFGSIDYEVELFGGNFANKLKEIAKKQREHIESREDIIKKKILEYKEKKQDYYTQHKEKRLEYDKEYREKKKEKLKEYRKEYYRQNRESILAKQKQNRLNKKLEN